MYDHGLCLEALLLLYCPLAQLFAPVVIVDVIDELMDGTDACGAVVWVGQVIQEHVNFKETKT